MNCYHASEALYHLLGGKKAGFVPMFMYVLNKKTGCNETHWFLEKRFKTNLGNWNGVIIDVTKKQYKHKLDYSTAKGCGFLTKRPSKKARQLMNQLMGV